jgi:uncharacterized hydrophobic protein (TIGR00271 family)
MMNRMGELFAHWRRFAERPVPQEQVAGKLAAGAAPTVSFYFMLGMSAVIASFGLLANSAAVVIGAMIVAPLMNPIVALSYSLVVGRWDEVFIALGVVVTGAAVTVGIAWLITESIGWKLAGSEILARMRPTLLDFGVAMAAGAAAAFAYTRPGVASSLAGVAIAVALVPPLCTVGIVLALGDVTSIEGGLGEEDGFSARGPLLLFLSNYFGILLASGLVYFWQYCRKQGAALLRLLAAVASLIIVIPSLGLNMEKLLIRNQVHRSLNYFVSAAFGGQAEVRLTSIRVWVSSEEITVRVSMAAPSGAVTQGALDSLRESLTDVISRPVVLYVSQIPETRWSSEASRE